MLLIHNLGCVELSLELLDVDVHVLLLLSETRLLLVDFEEFILKVADLIVQILLNLLLLPHRSVKVFFQFECQVSAAEPLDVQICVEFVETPHSVPVLAAGKSHVLVGSL